MLLTACADRGPDGLTATPEPRGPSASEAEPVGRATAEQAFELVPRLAAAWKDRDCAEIASLTTGAEAVAAAECEAVRNPFGDADLSRPEFYLPNPPGARPWFAARAGGAYFLLVREDAGWRLALGPVPLRGEAPALPADAEVRPAPTEAIEVELAPQRHITYVADLAGVGAERFPAGDPIRELRREFAERPKRARPDILQPEIKLSTAPAYSILLPSSGALVFHTLELTFQQRSAGGGKLAKPLYGEADREAFTGEAAAPRALTGQELLFLVTRVDQEGNLTTVAMRRTLTAITTG
ncbi:hypothetical protein D5H75_23545 [Bailinhaonella thermotolerans]|uniref:Uncharacterized protein n=1 Tax=Bailinhaonella thermotolerans TaxID=1070861 RepID=A0A3A4AZ85_9ACTN|nr:hypothetical protein D5H75_23545 [Bailinhaonella thermotolerans]